MGDACQKMIVGGDSMLGAALAQYISGRGEHVVVTTRRKDNRTGTAVYLDFAQQEDFIIPKRVRYVFIVAFISKYEDCENNPQAEFINTVAIPELARKLLQAGVFVNFISTNTLFGGDVPWPDENTPHSPIIEYARHKDMAEIRLQAIAKELGCLEHLAITRFTKILAPDTPPLPSWLQAWRQGQIVTPFTDLIFAPVSPIFGAHMLWTIAESGHAGCFHVSGARNISYADLAQRLAERLHLPADSISPTSSTEAGVRLFFAPQYSGLGMSRTTELTGISPQPIDSVLSDLGLEARWDFPFSSGYAKG